jgi:hypothetical protein
MKMNIIQMKGVLLNKLPLSQGMLGMDFREGVHYNLSL